MNDSLLLASVITVVLAILLPFLFHLSKHLGVSSDNARKNEPIECGVRQTHNEPYDTFNVKFFIVGIIFLVFDVEVLFMFPWALNLHELGFFALAEMFTFLGLLLGGLLYVYKSGVLKWT